MEENLLFFSTTWITNFCYKTLHIPWLGFHAVQLFLNRISSSPSSLHLQNGIVSTVWNRLNENICEIKKISDKSRKSKVASMHEDGKNIKYVSSKKFPIKTNPDNTTYNILNYKVILIKMWCNFKYYCSFRYPKVSFVLQFFHI